MLRQRVITGLTALAALLVVLFVLPAVAVKLIIAALILVGAWEWSGFLKLESRAVQFVYVGLMAALLGALAVLADERTIEMVFEIGPVIDSQELRNASSRSIPSSTKRR